MSAVLMVQDEAVTENPGPREGGPRRRRAFTAREKLDHLTAYEAACAAGDGGGGAYLREQGVYSSQITEWRKLRDAGLLAGKKPGEKIGRPSADQAEIARLTRELDSTRRRLAKTEAALDLWEKLTRSWRRSPRERTPRTSRGNVDRLLRRPGRRRGADPDAAALTGLSKATQDRRRREHRWRPPAEPAARPVPVNKLTDAEAAAADRGAELAAVRGQGAAADLRDPAGRGHVSVFDFHDVPDPGTEPRRSRTGGGRRRTRRGRSRSCRPPDPGRSTAGTSPSSPARSRASTSTAT